MILLCRDKNHCSYTIATLYAFKNIKNESHGTIHTFKNYFVIVFSVLTKISSIQTDPKNTLLKKNKNIKVEEPTKSMNICS